MGVNELIERRERVYAEDDHVGPRAHMRHGRAHTAVAHAPC